MRFHTRALGLALSVMVYGCGGAGTTEPPPPPPPPNPVPTSIQLSATSLALRIAESRQLTATVLDQQGHAMAGQTVEWSSSDPTKLSVDGSGLARGVSPGTATLSARSGSLSAAVAGSVLSPQPHVNEALSVTATIGEAGGTVTAPGPNGESYSLSVPAGSLEQATAITLTPITTMDNLPAGVSMLAAVRLRPDGLTFLLPAQLTITLSGAAPAAATGIRFADDGSGLTAVPAVVNGSQVTLLINHFSGAGAVTSPPSVPILGGSAKDEALAALVQEKIRALSVGSYSLNTVATAFRTWYLQFVKPRLQGLLAPGGVMDDPSLRNAIIEWTFWRDVMISYEPLIAVQVQTALAAELAEARTLAANEIKAAIQRHNNACLAQQSLLEAGKVLDWQDVATLVGLSGISGLDRTAVLAGLCVQVGYGIISFPDPVFYGVGALLRVEAGLRFGSAPLQFFAAPVVDVFVSPVGSSNDLTTMHPTDAAGIMQTLITPGPVVTLLVGLHSCIDAASAGLHPGLNDVCADHQLTRNVQAFQTVVEFAGTNISDIGGVSTSCDEVRADVFSWTAIPSPFPFSANLSCSGTVGASAVSGSVINQATYTYSTAPGGTLVLGGTVTVSADVNKSTMTGTPRAEPRLDNSLRFTVTGSGAHYNISGNLNGTLASALAGNVYQYAEIILVFRQVQPEVQVVVVAIAGWAAVGGGTASVPLTGSGQLQPGTYEVYLVGRARAIADGVTHSQASGTAVFTLTLTP